LQQVCVASLTAVAQEPAGNQAPIATDTRSATVEIDDLEDKPENFVGKTVTAR